MLTGGKDYNLPDLKHRENKDGLSEQNEAREQNCLRCIWRPHHPINHSSWSRWEWSRI